MNRAADGKATRSSSRRRTSGPGASATNIGVMGSPQGNRFPTSEQMKITERITRLNNDFLLYEIKTEDPLDPHAAVDGTLSA